MTPSFSSQDHAQIRKAFPVLQEKVHGKPLVYLDNAASPQKPVAVLEAMDHFYRHAYANVHRGVHMLSAQASDQYEAVREKVRAFIGAPKAEEIVFTRGTTEALNLVAQSWGRTFLKEGDEIILTTLEHHANIIPWQFLRDSIGVKLRIVPLRADGSLCAEDFRPYFSDRTKLVCVAHISNALGTLLPIKEIAALAHSQDSLILVDGAQGVCHGTLDVKNWDIDFYAFSAHKLYGPTGVGVLYGKAALLAQMPPVQGGGDMIDSVTFEKTLFKDPPHRFEAGTPPIVEVIGLGAALDYLTELGMDAIAKHEAALLAYAHDKLAALKGVQIIGTAPQKAAVLSFIMDCAHPHDIGTILDSEGIAIRSGHHCAQPLMEALNLPGTARASLALYNTQADIDALVCGIEKVQKVFA